ncbi:hypothetical protein L2X99_12795 [Microbacterium sp. KUDC0406]|uniref:hypothetical protein n=1 Tax=Microbacterium sp. KUDC0406 TaxID=2909588 RepID=UPI001F2D0C11|nr:hypothetical protein [Microbacterium sp. KUDC0406]UJP09306.1 hypothetical protein L2X99_12795 [Microbacterium sp. KUDC0406]
MEKSLTARTPTRIFVAAIALVVGLWLLLELGKSVVLLTLDPSKVIDSSGAPVATDAIASSAVPILFSAGLGFLVSVAAIVMILTRHPVPGSVSFAAGSIALVVLGIYLSFVAAPADQDAPLALLISVSVAAFSYGALCLGKSSALSNQAHGALDQEQ